MKEIFTIIFISYCSSTTEYWLHGIFAENDLASCLVRLSTGLGFCSKTGSDTFRSVLIYRKGQEPRKKYSIIMQKVSPS